MIDIILVRNMQWIIVMYNISMKYAMDFCNISFSDFYYILLCIEIFLCQKKPPILKSTTFFKEEIWDKQIERMQTNKQPLLAYRAQTFVSFALFACLFPIAVPTNVFEYLSG